MTRTSTARDPKNRLTRGSAALVAIVAALGGVTYGISTSPGSTRPTSGYTTSRPAAGTTTVRGESRTDNHQDDVVLLRKAGKPQQDYL